MRFVDWLTNLFGNKDEVPRTKDSTESTVRKMRCKSLFCRAMILPNTARKTNGFCMPCWTKKHAKGESHEYGWLRCHECGKPLDISELTGYREVALACVQGAAVLFTTIEQIRKELKIPDHRKMCLDCLGNIYRKANRPLKEKLKEAQTQRRTKQPHRSLSHLAEAENKVTKPRDTN